MSWPDSVPSSLLMSWSRADTVPTNLQQVKLQSPPTAQMPQPLLQQQRVLCLNVSQPPLA